MEAPVALVPSTLVTVTLTVPADPAGIVAVICVAESTKKLVAAVAPKLTAVTPVKPEPLRIMLLPPEIGPLTGLNAVTEGKAAPTKTPAVEPTEFKVSVRSFRATSFRLPPFNVKAPTVMPSLSRSPDCTV